MLQTSKREKIHITHRTIRTGPDRAYPLHFTRPQLIAAAAAAVAYR